MKFIVPLLLAAFLLQGALLIRQTSATTDEVGFHMVNGYTYLKTRDYRMSPANPALAREWMALPWLFLQPKLDLEKASWKEADSVPFSQEFLYRDNRPIAGRLIDSSRAMILLLGVLLGWLIYRWAGELYGPWGGILSLSLYVFSPVFTGHASIAHTDLAVSLFVFWAGYALWRLLRSESALDRLVFCAVFALGTAAKFHALFFGPVFLGIIVWKRGWKEGLKTGLLSAAVCLTVIWTSYLFDFKPLLAGGVPRVEQKLAMLPEAVRKFALETPVPAPSYWLGLAGIARSHRSPYLHYAFGHWTTEPSPFLYWFSFAAKMTIGFLALLFLRFIFWARAPRSRGENAILLLPAALWFAATTNDSTGVGVRYLLPVIPFLFVWVGGLAPLFSQPALKRWGFVVATFAASGAVSALAALPDHLSYFNEAVGGVRGGHRFVRGSDVDWGQGLKALKRYMDERNIPEVALRYFGTAEPDFYGVRHEAVSDEELKNPLKKVYAISLFNLEHAPWTKQHPPETIVGGSIAVYDLR